MIKNNGISYREIKIISDNNFNNKLMYSKYKHTQQQYYLSNDQQCQNFDRNHFRQPVTSPSPDKKSSNIITSTKSPQISEIKRQQYTPDKEISYTTWYQQRQSAKEKPFSANTPSRFDRDHVIYKIQQTITTSNKGQGDTRLSTGDNKYYSSGSGSRIRNTKIEIVTENTPEDFEAKQSSSRFREIQRSESMEDYLKLLKSKQETIKELKDIIDLIKRNNTSFQDVDEQEKVNEFKIRNRQLTDQVKSLKIQNQHLLNIIEKNKNVGVKQQILQRQIRQLRDTLREKQLQLEDVSFSCTKTINSQKEEIYRLQNENQSLLRILKEKDDSLGNSALSIQSKNSDKQKLSLTKIKEQHQQNLKLLQENIYREIQELERTYHYQLQELNKRIQGQNSKIRALEQYKNQIQRKRPDYEDKIKKGQQFHKQKQRHQEIQTLMLQKNSIFQRELSEQKKANERLIVQLSKATQKNQQLQNKLIANGQQLNQLKQIKRHNDEFAIERDNLLNQIQLLKKENNHLKLQFQEFASKKDGEIKELQKKIQLILLDYQTNSREERKNFSNKIAKLEDDLKAADKRERQIIDYYQKDKNDTEQKVKQAIDLYNQQNDGLKSSIAQKCNQLASLNDELQQLRRELSNSNRNNINQEELVRIESECNQLKKRCLNLQQETLKMTNQLVEMNEILQSKIKYCSQLQNRIAEQQQERSSLSKRLAEEQIKNDELSVSTSRKDRQIIDFQRRVEQLQKIVRQLEDKNSTNLSLLKKEVAQKEQKTVVLTSRISEQTKQLNNYMTEIITLKGIISQKQKQYSVFNQYENMEQELKELKRIVADYFSNQSTRAENQLVQEFYKLSHNYQIKIQENLRLMKQLEQLKGELSAKLREKEMLQEKVTYLQNNISILVREVKERRMLYDQLLQEKSRLQKEMLLAKKIKMEQSQIETNNKNNISQITSRIDRLMQIERQRTQNMKGLLFVQERTV